MHRFPYFFSVTALACLFFLDACTPAQVSYTPTNTGEVEDYSSQSNQSDRPGKIYEEMGMGGDESSIQEDLGADGGADTPSFDYDQQSDAYKQTNGRCSPGMKPVFFQFDRAVIEKSQLPNIEQNASHLLKNPGARVLIEGNTDERGTNDYNLALGERRAQIAKHYMMQLGVEAHRIRTVSYGEERPLFLGHSEDDYTYNRRDDFVLE